jgi:hypothetical protein
MSFEFRPAVREDVPLVLGLAGSTGSGKTFSALRLAKGLAAGKRFCIIDTENGRAKHYADQFDFDHGDLTAPFTPGRYMEAIKAADAAGYPVIVVDSASHEHAGDGGLLDMQLAVLDRIAGNDYRKREQATMAAWVEPKREHKRFVSQLLQLKAHLILCFRAEEKVEMAKEGGKMVVRPKRSLVGIDGWIPIAEKTLPYELTLSLLFTADQPGVPKPIKLQEQHRLLLPLDKPISEESGELLATWAKGAALDEDERTPGLTARLLDLADELGVREKTIEGIQKNRRANRNAPSKHADWLAGKIDSANTALEALESEGQDSLEFGS